MRPATLSAAGLAMTAASAAGRWALLLVLLGFLGISPALAGPRQCPGPDRRLLPSNAGHVIAISVWIGASRCCSSCSRARRARCRCPTAAGCWRPCSPASSTIAGACVAVVLLTGIVQSLVYVRNLDNLLHTEYRLVLRQDPALRRADGPRRLQPAVQRPTPEQDRGRRPSPRTSRRSAAARTSGEVLLVAVVLGVTGALAGAPATPRRPAAPSRRRR